LWCATTAALRKEAGAVVRLGPGEAATAAELEEEVAQAADFVKQGRLDLTSAGGLLNLVDRFSEAASKAEHDATRSDDSFCLRCAQSQRTPEGQLAARHFAYRIGKIRSQFVKLHEQFLAEKQLYSQKSQALISLFSTLKGAECTWAQQNTVLREAATLQERVDHRYHSIAGRCEAFEKFGRAVLLHAHDALQREAELRLAFCAGSRATERPAPQGAAPGRKLNAPPRSASTAGGGPGRETETSKPSSGDGQVSQQKYDDLAAELAAVRHELAAHRAAAKQAREILGAVERTEQQQVAKEECQEESRLQEAPARAGPLPDE